MKLARARAQSTGSRQLIFTAHARAAGTRSDVVYTHHSINHRWAAIGGDGQWTQL